MSGRGKIFLNGVDYSGSIFEANPEIPAGATVTPVTNMKVDDNYYNLVGSGGADVEGNPTVPSGVSPIPLTGLKIDNDYYSISGGGSSSITTETVTITTNNYGWGEIVDGNGVLLDPSTHKLISATVIVDNTVQIEQYLQCAFFRSQNNSAFSVTDLYAFTIQNLNDGGFIRNQGTYTIEISYL